MIGLGVSRRQRRCARRIGGAAALAALAVAGFGFRGEPAKAVVLPPVTVDGPSSQILDFGGVAMAADGTGGLVYTKAVDGVPHVFVSRYDGRQWGPPVRVDWDQPYDASQPRIAAGERGALMVVWVTQVATVAEKIRRGLWSASLGPGSSGFSPSLLVDPNVGEGAGVDPAVAGVSGGKAIVVYRVVTGDFSCRICREGVQLRQGDVLADIRLARFAGDRWSRIPPINRNPAASMRPPNPANGPQVGIGASGNAVVAWQEPEQDGTARIWERRIFGTTPGPAYLASPSSWEGKPVSGDVESFALDVTPFDAARVAADVADGGGSPARVFLSALGRSTVEGSGKPTPPRLVGNAGGPLGSGSVAAADANGGEGLTRLAFLADGAASEFAVAEDGSLERLATAPAPTPETGAVSMVAVDPGGGGLVAYPSVGPTGPAVAVRQQFPSGGAQAGLLSGTQAGPVTELAIGRSGVGDALIGFRQGEAGHYEIVAERVSAPPTKLQVRAPSRWIKPRRLTLRWKPPRSGVGGLTYSILLDGQVVKRGLRRLRFRPGAALLGNGVRRAQVLATDGLGGQLLSRPMRLRVDGAPPHASVHLEPRRGRVLVRLADTGSGTRAKSTLVSFGDGTREKGGLKFDHAFSHSGRYTLTIRARDRVGNRLRAVYRVRVR